MPICIWKTRKPSVSSTPNPKTSPKATATPEALPYKHREAPSADGASLLFFRVFIAQHIDLVGKSCKFFVAEPLGLTDDVQQPLAGGQKLFIDAVGTTAAVGLLGQLHDAAFGGAFLGIQTMRALAVNIGFNIFAFYSFGAALFSFVLYLMV